MTKVFVARPSKVPEPTSPGGKPYALSPEAQAIKTPSYWMQDSKLLTSSDQGGSKYLTDAGSGFDFEINLLDTKSKLPIRGVEIKVSDKKAFTDRTGRAVFRLPFGKNTIQVTGEGFIEAGDFAPRPTKFEPLILDVNLDSNEIYTLYSTGELVPGERRQLDNPSHNPGDLQDWLRQYWWVLGLAGVAGVTFYYIGKSKTPST